MAQYGGGVEEAEGITDRFALAQFETLVTELLDEEIDEDGNLQYETVGAGTDPITVDPETDVLVVDTSEGTPQITVEAGKPIVIVLNGAGGGRITVEYDGTEVAVTGGAGADVLQFIDVGSGPESLADSRAIPQFAPGDDGVLVDGAGGDDSIETASGADTVIGGTGDDSISTGAGDDSIGSGQGSDSVDAGSGWDEVSMGDGDYDFEVVDGEVVVSRANGLETTIANAEYIDLGTAGAMVNASNQEDATAARQAEAILGDQMSSDELREYTDLVNEVGLDAASASLMDSSGFAAANADLSNADYINLLYNNAFGRDVDPEGLDFYTAELVNGNIDRAKLAADLSWSDEGVESNDMVNTIDGLV